jgi:Ca2+-binding EF-hand superfamily protein
MSVDNQSPGARKSPRIMKSIPLLLLGLAAISAPAVAGDGPKRPSAKTATFTKFFNEADADENNILDEEEFANSYGASPRPVITEIRFDELASFIKVATVRGVAPLERGIFLEDFIDANGGRKIRPSKAEIFWAADDNESGNLDIEEFAATRVYPPSSEASIFKAFDKIDKDDNGLISPSEWGIQIVD